MEEEEDEATGGRGARRVGEDGRAENWEEEEEENEGFSF